MGAIPGKQGFSRKDSTSQENPPRFHAISGEIQPFYRLENEVDGSLI